MPLPCPNASWKPRFASQNVKWSASMQLLQRLACLLPEACLPPLLLSLVMRLPAAPCTHTPHRPTAEQWADPLQYISAIRPQAEVYGICRIIPPQGWAPPLALDKNAFRFNTVIQAVHRLQDRLSMPAQQAFYEDLKRLMHTEGKAPKKPPSFGGREVDLFRMYRAVAKRGGYAAVTEEKRWKDIVRVLQVCCRGLGFGAGKQNPNIHVVKHARHSSRDSHTGIQGVY